MADNLRERVARAIADVDCCAFDDPAPSEKAFKGCGKWDECMCRKEADAAISLVLEAAEVLTLVHARQWRSGKADGVMPEVYNLVAEDFEALATAIRNLGKEPADGA